MNAIQKKALKETVKTIAGLTAVAVLIPAAIFLIPLEVLGGIFSVVALCFATKMIYDTKLAQAKYNAEFNKTVDQ
jgi:uncharacterized membrane protein